MSNEDQAVTIVASKIPQERINGLARPLLERVAEAFKNPVFAAEYEEWLTKRYSNEQEGSLS